MHFLFIGLIILLSSCASPSMRNYYAQTVNSWHGGKGDALLTRWGEPDKQIISYSGNKFYIYKSSNYLAANTTTPTLGLNFSAEGKPIIVSIPNHTWNRGVGAINCMTAFEVDKGGKVISTQIGGSGCYGNAQFAETHGNPKIIA